MKAWNIDTVDQQTMRKGSFGIHQQLDATTLMPRTQIWNPTRARMICEGNSETEKYVSPSLFRDLQTANARRIGSA